MTTISTETYTPSPHGNSRTGLPMERRTRDEGWIRRIANGVRRAFRASSRRRTARALLTLDDCLLDDIGLTRAEAEMLVRTGRLFDGRS